MRFASILAAIFLLAILAACGSSDDGGGTGVVAPEPSNLPVIELTGASFQDGGQIPRDFACDGAGKSPNLLWHGTPDESKSTVVWLEDPDANHYVHWLVYDISPAESALTAGVSEEPILADGSHQGKNSTGRLGYTPPCPPLGETHHYEFHVYSLDKKLDLAPGASEADVELAMRQHIIAFGKLTATYSRPKSN